MVNHLFWDMGGTLVDTYPQLDAALAQVVTAHGATVTLDEVAELTRRSTGDAISALASRFGIDEAEFEAANDALKKHWLTDPAPVMPGAHEVMDAIRSRGGLNLVVTHRDRASATSLVDSLGLQIDDLVSTEDGFARKPDPAMYVELLRRHNLDPGDCLGVGDRRIDSQAARGAGMSSASLMPDDPDADHQLGELNDLFSVLGLPQG